MSYRQNAAANRDALFGSAPSKPRSNKPKARNVTSTKNPSRALPSSGTTYQRKTFGATSDSMNSGNSSGNTYTYVNRFAVNKKSMLISNLTGAAKANKMKEAEDFRLQAKKALTRGVFSKPNPVIAGTYYKRVSILTLFSLLKYHGTELNFTLTRTFSFRQLMLTKYVVKIVLRDCIESHLLIANEVMKHTQLPRVNTHEPQNWWK